VGSGGGIFCDEADLNFNDVVMEDNVAGYGGGLHQTNGTVSLIDVNIQGNQAEMGGGISTDGELYLESTVITENSAIGNGGGICCTYYPIDFCEEIEGRNSIYYNESQSGIGSDLYSLNPQNIKLNTFSVQYPTDYYAAPGEYFTFDIFNGLIPQIDDDIYVSAYGSNDNSGLSADQPLQTIRQACALIAVTDEDPHTIYLDAGTYSASETGESFPVQLSNNVSLSGVNRESVILDAEGNSGVMVISNKNNEGKVYTMPEIIKKPIR
jgi:predicted outer membrane repeat protein